jgi:hypothetical protein
MRVRRHFYLPYEEEDEDEDEKVPAPTKKRVRALQQRVLAEAEGLLGRPVPQRYNPPVREAIQQFWTPATTREDLQRSYEALVQQTARKAAEEADEDDIEFLLLTT